MERVDERRARVRFEGRFEGREVCWEATLTALGRKTGVRQFIDVGAPGPKGRMLRIGLAVERVDAATVRKAVIMMRNFKRLRTGRHEWSAPVPRRRD